MEGWRRYAVRIILGAAVLLGPSCQCLPPTGGDWERNPLQPRTPQEAGFNGTINDVPTSIDPRTRETDGARGRSIPYTPPVQPWPPNSETPFVGPPQGPPGRLEEGMPGPRTPRRNPLRIPERTGPR